MTNSLTHGDQLVGESEVLPAAMLADFNLIKLRQVVGYLEPRQFDIDIDMFVRPKLRITVKRSSRNFN